MANAIIIKCLVSYIGSLYYCRRKNRHGHGLGVLDVDW